MRHHRHDHRRGKRRRHRHAEDDDDEDEYEDSSDDNESEDYDDDDLKSSKRKKKHGKSGVLKWPLSLVVVTLFAIAIWLCFGGAKSSFNFLRTLLVGNGVLLMILMIWTWVSLGTGFVFWVILLCMLALWGAAGWLTFKTPGKEGSTSLVRNIIGVVGSLLFLIAMAMWLGLWGL